MTSSITINKPLLLEERISHEVNLILKKKKYLVLGLPGGRSIQAIFPLIKKLPWDKIHVFMVDERLVSTDDDDSNFLLLKNGLFDELVRSKKMPKKNLHPFVLTRDKDFGAEKYFEELRKFGGFDIVILGVGEDGHVAGLFPNHTIENESDRYFVFFDSPKLPRQRMTSSKEMLIRAKLGVFLYIGDSKKQAYRSYLSEKKSLEDCPSKIAYHMKSIIFKSW